MQYLQQASAEQRAAEATEEEEDEPPAQVQLSPYYLDTVVPFYTLMC